MKDSTKSSGKILSNFKAQVLKYSIILVFYQKDELQMVPIMQHFYKKISSKKLIWILFQLVFRIARFWIFWNARFASRTLSRISASSSVSTVTSFAGKQIFNKLGNLKFNVFFYVSIICNKDLTTIE